jgi:serine/threonine protein kinase
MTQRDVPDLFVADFGIASHVQTVGTRITGQRGTPGYEAPVSPHARKVTIITDIQSQEIRQQGYEAAFSQKSDIYAFGCILYRLCTLAEPMILDDVKPTDISLDYSIDLLSLISTMLGTERDSRPTATQVKEQLSAIALQLFQPATDKCRGCGQTFSSRTELLKHVKMTGHNKRPGPPVTVPSITGDAVNSERGLSIRGCASAPPQYHYDEAELDTVDPSPCVVCNRYFNTKGQFFSHLGGGQHWRNAKYIQKRKAENDLNLEMTKGERRFEKSIRRDMKGHN